MRQCIPSCSLAVVFFVSMLYFTYWKIENKGEVLDNFEKLLTHEQKQLYNKIKKERRTIYMQGYMLGLFLSILVIIYRKYKIGKDKLSNTSTLCIIFAVSFLTNYGYYILHPKSTYMVTHLTTQRQTEAWLKVYRAMQYNYHLGFVFGIIALILLSHGVCLVC
jgi:heme/copper-type cytochrome/quinol oxidase subunit 4